MRNMTKTALLAGVAAGVLGLSGIAGPALAFDVVDWQWYKLKVENINVDGTVTFDLNPSGWVEIEKLQLFIGDVNAISTVSGVYNYQPTDGGGGDGTISFTVDYTGVADDSVDPSVFGTSTDGSQATLGGDLAGSGDITGFHDEGSDDIGFTATFNDIPVTIIPTGGFDALTELPSVESTAVAVGNNQYIDSQVALTLHDTQVLFGGFYPDGQRGFQYEDTGNSGFSLALAVLDAGANGQIYGSQINAISTVSDILNATVDSSATAVGNNTSINLDAVTADDANLEADLTQVAYANVTASSTVTGITLNGYYNLGQIGVPIVSSVATAVGNNLSINVTSPGP